MENAPNQQHLDQNQSLIYLHRARDALPVTEYLIKALSHNTINKTFN